LKFFNAPLPAVVIYLIFLGSLGFYYYWFLLVPQPMSLETVEFEARGTEAPRVKIWGQGLDTRIDAYLSYDSIDHSALVSNLLIEGYVADIQIVGERIYVGNLQDQSAVYSLEDPLHPRRLKILTGLPKVWHVDATHELVAFSLIDRGIYLYDQQSFARRGYHLSRDQSVASVLRRDYLYSVEGRAGLSIYDISDVEGMALVSQLELAGKAGSLAFSGDFLLVAARTEGLHVVDIRDPLHPRRIATLPAQRSYESVAVHRGYIYASDSFLQIDVLQIGTEGELRKIARIPLLGSVRDMVFGSERLYLAESQTGVRTVDIGDPAAPRSLGSVVVPGDARGLALSGNYLYVAAANAGVQIIDVGKIEPRRFLSLTDTPGLASHVVADGRWLYVADDYAGLLVLDRSAWPELTPVAQLPTDSDLFRLALAGNYLYGVTRGKQLLVFDVSRPQAPRLVHEQRMPLVITTSLVVCGNSLLVSAGGLGMYRIDISTPDKPRLIETIPLPDRVRQLAVQGNQVYIAAGRAGLLIARVEEGQPVELTSTVERFWPMSEFVTALGVALRGDFAYVSLGSNGLQVLNVADPADVQELLLLPIPGFVREVHLSKDFAVVADFENGYSFVNIQQPQRPFLAAQMPAPFRQVSGFMVDQELIYQPSRSSGVQVLPLPLALTQTHEDAGNSATFRLDARPEPGWYSLNLNNRRQFVSRPAVLGPEEVQNL
jgi:hypothetical protein